MNTPPLKPEQLSPSLSPMAFSLDDPSNGNGFQHLLSSPTKLKLDNVGGGQNMSNVGNSNGHSLIYRTSLSKLSELSRTGRSRQRSNSDTLRSSSPIRFQLFNNAPKMLRPEYISQQPSALPLLSTLMKQSATGLASNNKSDSKNRQADTTIRVGIRETLERLQREQQLQEKLQKDSIQTRPKDPLFEPRQSVAKSDPNTNSQDRKISDSDSAISGITLYDKQERSDETLKGKSSKHSKCETNVQDARVISSSSSIPSTVSIDFSDIPKELDIDLLSTDKNGFAQSDAFKSNRCSFISSTSTDYDADWYNHQQAISHEESAKLDYRIKQLELEIDELKLQNEKLIHSITTSRTVEDKFVFDALKEIRSSKQKTQRGMERKVKQLERKVENYRQVMKTLDDSPVEVPALKDKRTTYPMRDSTKANNTLRKRIARISSMELRKIEEQGDSSSSATSSSSSDEEEDVRERQLEDRKLREHNILPSRLSNQQDDASLLSARRKTGFQLNIHVEVQGNAK